MPLTYSPGDGSLPKSVDFPYGTQCSLVSVSVSRTPRPEADTLPTPQREPVAGDALDEFLDQAAGLRGKQTSSPSLCPTVSQLQPKQQKIPFSMPVNGTAYSPRLCSPSSAPCSSSGTGPIPQNPSFEYQHHSADRDLRRPVSGSTRPVKSNPIPPSNPFLESGVNGWTIDNTNSLSFECISRRRSDIQVPGEEELESISERYWGSFDRSTEDSPRSARE